MAISVPFDFSASGNADEYLKKLATQIDDIIKAANKAATRVQDINVGLLIGQLPTVIASTDKLTASLNAAATAAAGVKLPATTIAAPSTATTKKPSSGQSTAVQASPSAVPGVSQQAIQSANAYNSALSNITKTLGNVVGGLLGVQKATNSAASTAQTLQRTFSTASTSVSGGMEKLTKQAIGLGVALTSLNFGSSLLTNVVVFDSLQNALEATYGSVQKANEEFAKNRVLADQLGVSLVDTTAAYVSMSAAAQGGALEGEKTRDVFEAITKRMAVLGKTTEDTRGALVAIQQIMSKGIVSAEEVRQQLGERLPGALQISAKSMDVTVKQFSKMLELGQVFSNDFIPRFTRELDKLNASVERIDTVVAQINRVKNQWAEFLQVLAQSGATATIIEFTDGAIKAMKALQEEGAKANLDFSESVKATQETIFEFKTNLSLVADSFTTVFAAISAGAKAIDAGLKVAFSDDQAVIDEAVTELEIRSADLAGALKDKFDIDLPVGINIIPKINLDTQDFILAITAIDMAALLTALAPVIAKTFAQYGSGLALGASLATISAFQTTFGAAIGTGIAAAIASTFAALPAVLIGAAGAALIVSAALLGKGLADSYADGVKKSLSENLRAAFANASVKLGDLFENAFPLDSIKVPDYRVEPRIVVDPVFIPPSTESIQGKYNETVGLITADLVKFNQSPAIVEAKVKLSLAIEEVDAARSALDSYTNSGKALSSQLKELSAQQDAIIQKLAQLNTLYVTGQVKSEEYQSRHESLRSALETTKGEISRLNQKIVENNAVVDSLMEEYSGLIEKHDKLKEKLHETTKAQKALNREQASFKVGNAIPENAISGFVNYDLIMKQAITTLKQYSQEQETLKARLETIRIKQGEAIGSITTLDGVTKSVTLSAAQWESEQIKTEAALKKVSEKATKLAADIKTLQDRYESGIIPAENLRKEAKALAEQFETDKAIIPSLNKQIELNRAAVEGNSDAYKQWAETVDISRELFHKFETDFRTGTRNAEEYRKAIIDSGKELATYGDIISVEGLRIRAAMQGAAVDFGREAGFISLNLDDIAKAFERLGAKTGEELSAMASDAAFNFGKIKDAWERELIDTQGFEKAYEALGAVYKATGDKHVKTILEQAGRLGAVSDEYRELQGVLGDFDKTLDKMISDFELAKAKLEIGAGTEDSLISAYELYVQKAISLGDALAIQRARDLANTEELINAYNNLAESANLAKIDAASSGRISGTGDGTNITGTSGSSGGNKTFGTMGELNEDGIHGSRGPFIDPNETERQLRLLKMFEDQIAKLSKVTFDSGREAENAMGFAEALQRRLKDFTNVNTDSIAELIATTMENAKERIQEAAFEAQNSIKGIEAGFGSLGKIAEEAGGKIKSALTGGIGAFVSPSSQLPAPAAVTNSIPDFAGIGADFNSTPESIMAAQANNPFAGIGAQISESILSAAKDNSTQVLTLAEQQANIGAQTVEEIKATNSLLESLFTTPSSFTVNLDGKEIFSDEVLRGKILPFLKAVGRRT